jgi:hypothetical protein
MQRELFNLQTDCYEHIFHDMVVLLKPLIKNVTATTRSFHREIQELPNEDQRLWIQSHPPGHRGERGL